MVLDNELLDDITLNARIEDYSNTGKGNYDDFTLTGHCRKKFVRIKDNSVEYENKFLKSINPVFKISSKERLMLLFNTYVLRKKNSFVEYLGTKNLTQKTMKDSVVFQELFQASLLAQNEEPALQY
jgi:hypothetical protein